MIETRLGSIPEAQRGYIVGMLSVSCEVKRGTCEQGFNSISAQYRMTTDHEVWSQISSIQGSTFRGDTVHDYINSSEGHKGFSFCTALPPGTYEFHAHSYYDFAGGGSGYSVREKDYYSIPFVVKPGEISDLGMIRITSTKGANIFGMPLSAPGVMVLMSAGATAAESRVAKCPDTAKRMPVHEVPLRLAPGQASPFVQVRSR